MGASVKGDKILVKKCIGCGITKSRSEFHKSGGKEYYRDSRCKICRSIINRTAHKPIIKNEFLKKYYGITIEEYNLIFLKQNGCCAICGKHESEFSKSLSVDHDHVTGKIRGLLCIKCNLSIGGFEDNIELLDKAKEYLSKKIEDVFLERP
jgi:hypothetical protein